MRELKVDEASDPSQQGEVNPFKPHPHTHEWPLVDLWKRRPSYDR